ncbi:MAG: hypothetical protein WCG10_06455 [Chlamydiota bacterium]
MPVEQVQGASGSNEVGSQPMRPVDDSYLFGTNYILLVMKYTNVAMEHQANLVAMQGQLENVETQIQGCLSTISEFFSTLQANAGSGGGWNANGFYAPNANSGLSNSFYHMNENLNDGAIGSDSGSGDVNASYQASMRNFLSAFNQLFNCSDSGTGPTLSQVMNIALPDGSGRQFSMNNYYGDLAQQFAQTYGVSIHPVISEGGNDPHVSLLQQYMYYQAQLTVNTDPLSQVEAAWSSGHSAHGINSLIDFDPSSSGCDPNVTSMLQILNDMDTPITVSRTGDVWENGQDVTSGQYVQNVTATSLLQMIGLNNMNPGSELNNQVGGYNPNTKMDWYTPGLYAAFSYAAFNYIWTKNPTMNITSPGASNDPNQPPWFGDFSNSTDGSTGNGDMLSELYSHASSSETSLSSSGSTGNATFQEQVNGVQQEQNVAQNFISGWASAMTSVVGNWKSQ